MRYLPLTEKDRKEMMIKVAINSVDSLFTSIPESYHINQGIGLKDGLSESELLKKMEALSLKNKTFDNIKAFIGAGLYNHYIPVAVDHIISRSEFYTAYTPYQPEISQGTLQAIFEFQTLISQLFDMEITNASMYDGATSLVEAILMSKRVNGKNKSLISKTVHPEYRETVATYFNNNDYTEISYTEEGITNIEELISQLDNETTSVVIQYPNFLGNIEDLPKIRQIIDEKSPKALFIVVVTEALSMGLLTPPGSFGADIVVAEGQSLGLSTAFGGPGIGLFSCKSKYLRKMPGRIAGETVDKDGERSFVFTISTREQHIRREKATSNICSNHSLNAVSVAVYLSLMGKEGIKEIALSNFYNTQYAIKILSQFPSIFKIKYGKKVFNEFVLEFESSIDLKLFYDKLFREKNILLGLPLKKFYPKEEHALLLNFTEQISTKDIDDFAKHIIEVIGEL
jgi:glycine dehydrogenase subunit 1